MEFQAVVLADHDDGSGTRLYPLLESTPKSLLPVAGRPLISYQLALLERSGFKEAIVVTTEKAREELHSFNEARASKEGATTIAIEIVALDEDFDTADCLRAIKHKIRKDFVVLSGDLVTDVFVHHLADVHRMTDATCSVLLRGPKEVALKPGEKPKKNEGAIPDFVGLDERKSRLLCLQSASDVEDALTVSRAMLRAYPNMTVTNKMLDSHFYIFSHWVLDLLEAKKDICSIKCELLPFLIGAHCLLPPRAASAASPSLCKLTHSLPSHLLLCTMHDACCRRFAQRRVATAPVARYAHARTHAHAHARTHAR